MLEADQQRVTRDGASAAAQAAGPGELTVLRMLENYLASFVLRPARPAGSQHHGFWTEEYGRADRSLRLAYEVTVQGVGGCASGQVAAAKGITDPQG